MAGQVVARNLPSDRELTRMIVTVTPNPALDRTLEFDVVRPGAVNRARSVHVEPSGKGVNVSRALAVNGVASRAILPMGGAEGRQLAELLDSEGIDYVAVPVRQSVRVNVSVLTADGAVTKLNEPGQGLAPDEVDAIEQAIERTIQGAAPGVGWIVGSGSLAPGMGADFYARLAERAHANGAGFALDSSGPALRAGLAARPELIKPNRDELAELADWPLRTLGDLVGAASMVRTSGVVLVSLGCDGAVLVDGEGALHGDAPVEAAKSAVGAGDNLLAGYLSVPCASRAEALREALAWAAVAVRAPRSVGRPVTDADRASVRIHPAVDLARRLG